MLYERETLDPIVSHNSHIALLEILSTRLENCIKHLSSENKNAEGRFT
jgi:hypothetical protein